MQQKRIGSCEKNVVLPMHSLLRGMVLATGAVKQPMHATAPDEIPGHWVRTATTYNDLNAFRVLAREYLEWLGEDLNYQQVRPQKRLAQCCLSLLEYLPHTLQGAEIFRNPAIANFHLLPAKPGDVM
jgi:hypothetical protein